MRTAIASLATAALLAITPVTAVSATAAAVSPATTGAVVTTADLAAQAQALTKRIRKGVYKPNGWHCPKNARIKGNRSSHIYHMPWQRYYTRTKPELCFTTEAVARHNPYRKSKV
jgi:hypothetical protein